MTGQASRLRTCAELALRLAGVIAGPFAMSGLLAWVWTTEITPAKILLAWVGWCAAIRLTALAMGGRRPGLVCYALALVPAASPVLAMLGVYWFWALLAG